MLATATVGARHISKLHERAPLAKSFEADPEDWSDASDGATNHDWSDDPNVLSGCIQTRKRP